MANLFLPIVAPPGNGTGAAVDFSTFGAPKTITVTGTWVVTIEPTVIIEMNNDPAQAGTWAPVATFQGGGNVTVEVAARWLRVRVENFRGGSTPDINVGGTSDGTLFAALVATAGDGSGAAVDVSALGLFKTVHVGGAFRGSTVIEISEDGGVTWSQEMAFAAGGAQSAVFAADFMRVSRNAVPLNTPGLPIINVGACEFGGGGGGGGVVLTDLTPPALPAGTTNNYTPAGFAAADRIRQATNTASSALGGFGALPNGTVRYLENLGPGALTLLDESATSIAADRFTTPNAAPLTLPPGGAAHLVYDGTSTRWLVLAHAKAVPYFNVQDYGAPSDGVSDAYPRFKKCVDDAILAGPGAEVVVPPGTYLFSQYLDVPFARGLTITSKGGAIIRYPSDDAALLPDPIADTNAKVRSGFLARYCTDLTITGLTFEGGTAGQITDLNVGCGIYATHCVNTRIDGCNGLNGNALYVQDATLDSTGTGTALGVAAGIVTLTDVAAPFNPGFEGRSVTLAGCTNAVNDGSFTVVTYLSPTQISFPNAGGIAEGAGCSWTVNNGDRLTRIENCSSYGCRGPMRTGSDGTIATCSFEQPMNNDATGEGDSFTIVGTTVTLHDASAPFLPYHDKKYIKILNPTSGANAGLFQLTYISSTTVSWTNAAGVAELYTGQWWIMGGDKTGIGNGAGAFTVALGVTTFTASAPIFQAADVDKVIRFAYATTFDNDGQHRIKTVVSSTQVTFDNALGVAEAFAQGFSVDAYDNRVIGGFTYGSTHAIYLFAGRSNVTVEDCTFKGIRTTALKVSGSSSPIRNIAMTGCYVEECASAFIGGADDAQEHTGFQIEGNQIVNTGTGRRGWTESIAVQVIGASGVAVRDNKFFYGRNAFRAVDGSPNLAGMFAIQGARYVQGRSQPLTDIMIDGNTFTADANATSPASILNSVIAFEQVGVREIYGADATVSAKVGNICTLTSAAGMFSRAQVGCSLTLVFSAGGNDVGPVPVLSVAPGGLSLTYENAGGTAGFSAGTFRITAPGGQRGGAADVLNNDIHYVGANGIISHESVAVTVADNTFAGTEVLAQFEGDVTPRIYNNRQIGRASDTAGIRLNNRDGAADGHGVAWPYIDDNLVTNNAIGPARDWGIGVGVNGGTYADFPLLGKKVRTQTSDGREEVVFAYGSGLVDGDTVVVDDGGGGVQTYTYKTAAPAGNQFNSVAGLIALINAQANIDCTDYGAGFQDSTGAAAPIVTNHLRVRSTAVTANTDGTLKVTCSALLPTALVALPNTASPNIVCGGRGSGSGGPTADKTVIWSPLCTFEGGEVVIADNASAQALLVTGGYRSIRNPAGQDGGSNTLISLGTTAGTEQFRCLIG